MGVFCTLQQPSQRRPLNAALSRDVHPLAVTTGGRGWEGGGRSGTIDALDVCFMQVHLPSHT